MLQAYGLQRYISSKGVFPEIIDYFPEIYKEELSLLYVGDRKYRNSMILSAAYLLIKLPSRLKRKYNFSKFKKQYLNISHHRYKSYEELVQTPPKYDAYICGSDQIWNTKGVRGWNPTFYLQFVKDKSKRNSYAASMSLDFPISDKVKMEVFPMIEELSNISVRENNIRVQIQKYIDKPIEYVLDPVYLLSAEEWNLLCRKASPEKEDYILIYPMENSDNIVNNAVLLSKYTGLPIYCISASSRKIKGVTKQFDCTISKFVRLFKDARYVITNSFHGTSFSIIFRKDFWSCQVSHNNHRITEILTLLNQQNRFVADGNFIDIDKLKVDYSISEAILREKIESSKAFLNRIVEN